jgi:hypothetical protein
MTLHRMIPNRIAPNRIAGAAALVALCLTLAACLLTPGKFTSQLDVRKDGRFSFSYAGEIHLLALSKLAQLGEKTNGGSGSSEFTPENCYRPGTLVKRPCTAAETAEQRQRWQDNQKTVTVDVPTDKSRRDAEAMKAMLGGIDPSSPKAAEDLAARLRRQEGWRRVDYKGDGLFDVDFAISGTLDRDFTFPSIERFPMANAFVTINRHNDGTVRIDAPGFATAAGAESLRSLMLLGAAGKDAGAPTLPVTEGRFTVTTDAAILANNTDEGPAADTTGQRLTWPISVRPTGAPTALLRLGR